MSSRSAGMRNESKLRGRSQYYLWGGLICASLAFIGFARTYYLKDLFGTPPLPWQLSVHGLIMSAWSALFVVQACLVAMRRTDIHRRLGLLGAGLAFVVVAAAAYITISATAGEVHAGVGGKFHFLFGFNLLNLLIFCGLFCAALVLRRRPDFHKRFMLLALISLLPPAIARATLLLTSNQAAQMLAVDVVIIVFAGVDIVRSRRLHPAFGWGALALLVTLNLGYLVFQTDSWTNFVSYLFA
jgi:hypothetical protein